jgi:hypothetical protein
VVHGTADGSTDGGSPGEPAGERGFVALYGRAGRLRGVLGLARPKLVMGYLKPLAAGITWDDALAHAAAAS